MKKLIYLSFMLLLSAISISSYSQFTAGRLVTVIADASAANTTCSYAEFTTSGSAGTSGSISSGTRVSGSATSTLYAATTNDGTLFTFTGVNSVNTSTNVNALGLTNGTTGDRAVITLNSSATAATATTYRAGTGNQTRGAVSKDNTNWYIGDQGGFYTNSGSSGSGSPNNNVRSVKSFAGTVYFLQSSSTSTIIQVSTISSPSGGTVTGLTGLTNNANAQDFYMIASGSALNGNSASDFDILYVVSATSNTAGTISKYSLVSGTWTANGSYTTSFGGFGLLAQKKNVGAELYVSTGQGALTANNVVKLTDAAGYNSTINITNNGNIYTAATGKIAKGVAFAPAAKPWVNLNVNATAGTEAGTTQITVVATASAAVTTAQTVDLAVSGTGITAGDYTLGNTTITIAAGKTTGTTTFTIVDDAAVEADETATLTISNPSSGITINTASQNITITDNDVNSVNLSVDLNTGSETAQTVITVTATAITNVASDQTLTVGVSGTNITTGDYTLSNTTLTIPSGQSTGSVTFTIQDDALAEGTETATISISNPSSGIVLGTTTTQDVTITDNDQKYYWNGATPTAGSGVTANGGTGTWSTANAWVQPTNPGTGATWTNGNPAVIAGTAGTITLSDGTTTTASSIEVKTTNYTLTSNGGSATTLNGNIVLDAGLNLNLNDAAATANRTLYINSVSGGAGSSLTLKGAQTGSNNSRVDLNLNGSSISVPINLVSTSTSATALIGLVGRSGTGTISGTITNNSSSAKTMLGATSGNTLTVSGAVTGSAGVQFSAGTNGGAGTINLNAVNTYTGSTSFMLTSSTGTVKLGISNALPATAVSFGDGSAGIGGKLDLNGFDETIGALSTNVTTSSEAIITNNATGTSTNTLTINQSVNTTFAGQLNDGTTRKLAVTKTGTGTLKLTTSNTFTGGLTIAQGTFQLGNGNIIDNNNPVTLNGGTLSTGSSGGFNETMGVLTLSGNSKISFGTGNHTLTFDNSSSTSASWTGTLTIDNWTGTAGNSNTSGPKIVFGSDNTGLTSSQLSQITFTGFNAGAAILSNGEVVPASANLVVDQSGITSFGNINVGSSSADQYFTVSGTALNSTVVITPIAGYEISTTSGSGYVTYPSTITLSTTNGVLSATDIYVRFTPTGAGVVSGNISVTSGSATQNVAVTGTSVLSGVYSVGNGDAQTAAIWSYTTNGTGQTITALGGFTSTLDVTIQTGNNVTLESTTAGPSIKNLTVQTGATLKRVSPSLPYPHTINDMKYISVFGDITCNGTIGDGTQFDAIGFNIEGVTCNIIGTGTNNFNAGRIRKSASTNATTTLNLNKDVDVWFPGTAVYSNAAATAFNINVAPGVNLDFHNGADLAIDGTDGAGSGNRGGTITVNGSITNVDVLFAKSDNSNVALAANGLIIPSGGIVGVNVVTFDRNTGSGVGKFNLDVQSGGTLNIYTGLELRGGTLTAAAGSNIVLKSTSASNSSYIDNFSSGYTGTYSGNITIERYVAGPAGSNQHFVGLPVSGATLSVLGANSNGGRLIPKSTCDETEADPSTPSSKVYEWQDSYLNGSASSACPQLGWYGKTSADAVVAGQGYSAYLTSGTVLSATGTPNIDGSATAYQLTGLGSGGWDLKTLQTTGTSFSYKSGWHLVSNPFPNSVALNSHAGFDNIAIWNPSGPFSGTFTVTPINGATVAPFQGFYVHVATTGTTNTWKILNSERTLATNTQFHSQTSNNALTISISGNGFNDVTHVEFNPNATAQLDADFDARKLRSALGQPTVYTWANNEHLSHNVNKSIEETPAIPLGVLPGANGTYTFNFDGINTFDPTSYIYLEDLVTGAMVDVRQNPTYTFTMNATDSELRFVLHFTPAAQITTVDAGCTTNGNINIVQPGNSTWSYTLTDASSNSIGNGTLDVNSPLNVNVHFGIYSLMLTGTNGYAVMKNITIGGAQPVEPAAYSASSNTVEQNDDVTFVSTNQNISSYDWSFGDGTTGAGAVATHGYTTPGVYTATLVVSNQYGCQSSTNQIITVTEKVVSGINNVAGNEAVSVWSNGNRLFVDFSKQKNVAATIEIYNVLGQQISTEKFDSGTVYTKSILNIETAYVIVRIKNNNEIVTKKVLITN